MKYFSQLLHGPEFMKRYVVEIVFMRDCIGWIAPKACHEVKFFEHYVFVYC